MRKSLFVICLCGVSCAVHAQRNLLNWENLAALHAGDKIQVRETGSKKVTGTFAGFSDGAITLQSERTSQSIQKQDVVSIRLMKNRHRLLNSMVLGGVGAGAGAGIGAAQHQGCSAQSFCLDFGGRTWPALIGGAIGLLGGGITGALLPSHETIYTLKAH